ncbi:uncharacterized protein K444DRAFT_518083 [Hyaloscypha bicolor E]|uniref:Uncharacterized protein n=1 Tax=Hyaloscypha bicolor E TaxID=1095630 RepID=A0A2J6TTH5_9HELO|nr:uncharacterized protein K444DRAFT_518083 [Hyaloscypha bicolor E]PMD66313.1 hypothetical protein K444DRAFT_518083 [Hyaloscypha bicolor E]
MASVIYSVEAAKETFFKHGFLDRKNPTVRDSIQEIEKKGFEFFSEYSLDFCYNETCILAYYLRYIVYPGHIICFRRGSLKAGRQALVVYLLAKGSRVSYYSGSHNHFLPTIKELRFLNEIS